MRLRKKYGRSEGEREKKYKKLHSESNTGVYVFRLKIFWGEYRFCMTVEVIGSCVGEMEVSDI